MLESCYGLSVFFAVTVCPIPESLLGTAEMQYAGLGGTNGCSDPKLGS
jgi:hypothetical protein